MCARALVLAVFEYQNMHSQDNLRKLGPFSGATQTQRTVIELSACLCMCM